RARDPTTGNATAKPSGPPGPPRHPMRRRSPESRSCDPRTETDPRQKRRATRGQPFPCGRMETTASVRRSLRRSGTRRVAGGLEGIALDVVRPGLTAGQLTADPVQRHQILDHATEIPGRIELIGRLMVGLGGVARLQLAAEIRTVLDVIDAALGVQRRHAVLGETEVVGAEEEALLHAILLDQHPPL